MKGDAPMVDVAAAFEDVSVNLGGVAILDGVTAAVPCGSSTAIVGPNGAGKTTLLLALLGEIPHGGRIVLRGRDGGPVRIGYVPQRCAFDRGMPLTSVEFLALQTQRSPVWTGIRRAQRDRARALLDLVGAAPLEGRPLGALSGGELQRVLLAAALGATPDLLILDEPAAGVDVRGGIVFCELMESLRSERGFTQIMVSHDLAVVTHHATHVIALNRRVVASGPPKIVLTPPNLMELFGIHMGLVDRSALPESRANAGGER